MKVTFALVIACLVLITNALVIDSLDYDVLDFQKNGRRSNESRRKAIIEYFRNARRQRHRPGLIN